jgi:hypothetical protein
MSKQLKQQTIAFFPESAIPLAVAAAGDDREVVVTTTTTTTTTEVKIKAKEVKPTIAKKKKRKQFGVGAAANMNGPPKPQHKLVLSKYIEDAMSGVGDSVFLYANSTSPLATKSSSQRGAIAEDVTKRLMTKEHAWDITVAATSADVNGRDRTKGQERYDFGRRMKDGVADRTVEVKLSRYSFDKSDQRWVVHFEHVKTELHDDLILVVEGLDGMHFFRWGGQNLSTNGKSTESEGGQIQVVATCNEPDVDVASAQLMVKMKARNTFLGSVLYTNAAYTDLFATTVRSEGFYADSPLSLLSGKARGDFCENVVREVLAKELGHVVENAEITNCVNGASCGANSTKYDFKVDGKRTEVKSARVVWNKTKRGYMAQFKDVKLDDFDELYVSLEGPDGLHIFLHDPKNGYSTAGKKTEANGGVIQMSAPGGKKSYTRPSAVELFLLKNFKWWNSEYIAFVAFADGDAERLLKAGDEHGTVLGGGGADEDADDADDEDEDDADADDADDDDDAD